MRRLVRFHLALGASALLLLTAAGCDALGLSGPCYRGVVVDAETGDGIESIHMSLQNGCGGFGCYSVVAFSFTGRDGQFRLCNSDRRPVMGLWANSPHCYFSEDCPAHPRFYGYGPVFYTDRDDIRIELQRRGE